MSILQALGEVCESVYLVRGQIRLTVKVENEHKVWAIIEQYRPQYGVGMRTTGKDGMIEMRLI